MLDQAKGGISCPRGPEGAFYVLSPPGKELIGRTRAVQGQGDRERRGLRYRAARGRRRLPWCMARAVRARPELPHLPMPPRKNCSRKACSRIQRFTAFAPLSVSPAVGVARARVHLPKHLGPCGRWLSAFEGRRESFRSRATVRKAGRPLMSFRVRGRSGRIMGNSCRRKTQRAEMCRHHRPASRAARPRFSKRSWRAPAPLPARTPYRPAKHGRRSFARGARPRD